MVLTGAEIITEVLKEQSVDIVFGYSDGVMSEIFDVFQSRENCIRYVLMTQGQSAVFGAEGYARATGKTGVVIASEDCCEKNLITGIATAYMDSVPLVVVMSGGSCTMIDKEHFVVQKVSGLAYTLRKAFCLAREGRQGPVLIWIPRAVLWSLWDFTHEEYQKESIVMPDPAVLLQAAELINNAKQPLLLCGGGAVNYSKDLLSFMKKCHIPGVYTFMSASVLPFHEPLNVGMGDKYSALATRAVMCCSDLIIGAGLRFSDRILWESWPFTQGAEMLYIDSDPVGMDQNVKSDIWLAGNIGAVLNLLKPLIKSKKRKNFTCRETVPSILFDIMEEMYPSGVYTIDTGAHRILATKYIKHKQLFLTSGGLSTMGFGYAAAIGASLGLKTRVFHITGDGSFYMNLKEAAVAIAYRTPVISVVFNNRSFRTGGINYMQLAERLGVKIYSCNDTKAFRIVLGEALNYQGPVWIELRVYDREVMADR